VGLVDKYRAYQLVNKWLQQQKGQNMKSLLINWKTSLGGLIALVGMIGPLLHVLTSEQALAIAGLGTAFGLVGAKDANVTGGTKQQ